MTKAKNNLGLYILLLAIVLGALLAAIFIRYDLKAHKGHLVLGDSTHGIIAHSQRNGLADYSHNRPISQSLANEEPAGGFVEAAGNIN